MSACGNQAANVHTCYEEYLCTDDGSIIQWHQAGVPFTFDPSVPDDIRTAMHSASTEMNSALVSTQLIVDSENRAAPAYRSDYSSLNQDGINGIYYVRGNWPWTTKIPGSLAVTLTRFDADGMIEADVFIKENPINLVDNDPAALAYWLRYLGTHELGHSVGRAHSRRQDSIMYPSVRFTNDITPTGLDGSDIFSLYDRELFRLL